MSKKRQKRRGQAIGVWYAIAAYGLWGILPGYWKLLQEVPAREILAHRFVWAFLFVVVILAFNGQWVNLWNIMKDRRKRTFIVSNALFISANWFIYIYAVNSGHIIEASLGYYINPLISVVMGLLFLREQMGLWQWISLALAAAGVAVLTFTYGGIPWIAISLALTFGFYGLIKKMAKIDSMLSLSLETVVIVPFALSYLIYKHVQGAGSFGLTPQITILLVFSGVITAVPLLLFAKGAERISLTTLGFTQYLSPTLSLLIGVFIYNEPFTFVHAISFGLIWSALVIYALSQMSLGQYRPGQYNTYTK